MVVRGHAEALVGRTIDRKYLIEKLLGTGSMGAVYRAHQLALDRTVAIKVMSADLASEPDFAERFHREAKAASRLAHPSSVGVSDFGEDGDGLLYLVMEYVPGKNLDVVIQEEFPLAERRIVDILSQVLSAVASAHDLGIVHRDLKPENILVVPSVDDEGALTDIVKVCDFGIAKMLGVDDAPASSQRGGTASEGRKLTAFGAILGTPAYMSPEQGQGLPPEPRSDLYAIGGMLFEMLTKRIPFDLDAPEDLVRAHMVHPVPDPRELVPACSPTLADVCVRALQKSPDARFPSARAMRASVRRVLHGTDRDEESAPLSLVSSVRGGRGTDASLPPAELTNTGPTDLPATYDSSRATLPVLLPGRGLVRRTWRPLLAGGLAVVALSTFALASREAPPARVALAASSSSSSLAEDRPAASSGSSSSQIPSPAAQAIATATGLGAAEEPPRRPSSTRETGGANERATATRAPAQLAPPTTTTSEVVASKELAVPVVEPAVLPVPAAAAAATSSEPAATVTVAAPYAPDRAQVVVTVTGATGTSRAVLTALVSHVSFADCYRTALRALGGPQGGRGTMHLEIDEDGVVQGVSARLPPPLSSASACFVARIQRQRLVRPPDTGAATGELELELSP